MSRPYTELMAIAQETRQQVTNYFKDVGVVVIVFPTDGVGSLVTKCAMASAVPGPQWLAKMLREQADKVELNAASLLKGPTNG